MSHPPRKSSSKLANPRLASVQRLRQLSQVLDNAIPIPGTGYRIGLDPILGLIPGGGDTITGIFSTYIIVEAARMGVPRATLLKMAWNIILEVVLGTVPLVGDIFDATWKANIRNMELLETHLELPRHASKRDRTFVIFLVIGLVVVIIGFAAFSILIVRLLIGLLTGGS